MTCLILACCRCDRVPALLFVRPYCAQRRWTIDGEIELTIPPGDDAVPQWPKKVFLRIPKFDGVAADRKSIFSATALGIPGRVSNGIEDDYLAPVFKRLRHQNILHAEIDEDVLFFKMDEITKDEIWKQTSADDRLLVWFDLLKMIIYSHPDVHGELLWQKVLACCKTVIDSTVMPFLSVLDWTQLKCHQSIVHLLIPFLIHYSIFDGFSCGTCLYINQILLRKVKSGCTLEVKHMITLLEFREDLVHQLLQSHPEERQSIGLIFNKTQSCLETARLRGLFGFIISSVSRSIQRLPSWSDFNEAAQRWRNGLKGAYSIMERLSNVLLSLGNPIMDRDENMLDRTDLQTKFAIASALIEHNNYIGAYEYLTACVRVLGSGNSSGCSEYFVVVTELIKCCNALRKEAEAEALVIQALQEHSLNPATPSEVCYMQVALADSRIGQGKYSEAQQLLHNVLTQSLSVYLRQAVSLRLNKVKRRLRTLDISAVTSKGGLFAALFPTNNLGDDVRHECLDELSSTVYCIQQGTTDSSTALHSVFTGGRGVTDINTMDAKDWRGSFLYEQIQKFQNTSPDHDNWRETKEKSQRAFEGYKKVLDARRWSIETSAANMPTIPTISSERAVPESSQVNSPPDTLLEYNTVNDTGSNDWDLSIGKPIIRNANVQARFSKASEAVSEYGIKAWNQDLHIGQRHNLPNLGSNQIQQRYSLPSGGSSPPWLLERPTTPLRTPPASPERRNSIDSENLTLPQLSVADDITRVENNVNHLGSLSTLEGHTESVWAVAFSPDGKQIASASEDRTVRLWDTATGAARGTLQGHLKSVWAVAFSPDGKQIASTSEDRTVRLWDAATGAARGTLKGHTRPVWAVAFSPNGKQIASTSVDSTVRLWDAATGAVAPTKERTISKEKDFEVSLKDL